MSIVTFKKTLAVCLACLTCVGFSADRLTGTEDKAYATMTIAELEARRQENDRKIEQYEAQLATFSESQKQGQAYQAALQEKIDVLQNNMLLLDTETENLKQDIFLLEQEIASMEETIVQQQERIDTGLEEFRQRLRAMYINGNDSLASVLTGATDFYDLLSGCQTISRVAKHDNALVEDLKQELTTYQESLYVLATRKTEQEELEQEKQAKQQEMRKSMEELQKSYADSTAEQERLALEEAEANRSIAELREDNRIAREAEAEIREQIRRAEEEAKRQAEEEAKRQAEEAARATSSMTETDRNTEVAIETNTEIVTEPVATVTTRLIATKAATTRTTVKTTTKTATTTTKAATTAESTTVMTAPVVTEAETTTDKQTESYEAYDASSFAWPCPGYYYISSGFGSRWGTKHKGIDIAQNAGADAVASRAGKVIKINTSCKHNYGKSKNCCGNGYGNYVLIDHEDGTYSTMYAHLQTVLVSVGDYVEKGQTIGYVGTTGHSTGYHLHFEVRKNGTAVNPDDYLNY